LVEAGFWKSMTFRFAYCRKEGGSERVGKGFTFKGGGGCRREEALGGAISGHRLWQDSFS